MKMTKQHFQLIADVLSMCRSNMHGANEDDVHDYIVREMTRALSGTNENFDSVKFQKACGYNN